MAFIASYHGVCMKREGVTKSTPTPQFPLLCRMAFIASYHGVCMKREGVTKSTHGGVAMPRMVAFHQDCQPPPSPTPPSPIKPTSGLRTSISTGCCAGIGLRHGFDVANMRSEVVQPGYASWYAPWHPVTITACGVYQLERHQVFVPLQGGNPAILATACLTPAPITLCSTLHLHFGRPHSPSVHLPTARPPNGTYTDNASLSQGNHRGHPDIGLDQHRAALISEGTTAGSLSTFWTRNRQLGISEGTTAGSLTSSWTTTKQL